jgi:ribonuclease G
MGEFDEEILIEVIPGETRIVITRGGKLSELFIARDGDEGIEGNLVLGRVLRVVPGIEAAFVEIGQPEAGFLAAAQARLNEDGARAQGPISSFVAEGDTVLVQVLADPVDGKGAKLTTRVTLPGRYLVFTPLRAGVSVSKRVTDEAAASRLARLIEPHCRPGQGYIARTRAVQAEESDLIQEAAALRALWEQAKEKQKTLRPPATLYADKDPVRQVLRERSDSGLRRVVIDDSRAHAQLRQFWQDELHLPGDWLSRHDGPRGLFESLDIESQIAAALRPRVELASGGSIIIEETQALCAVDVNSGARSTRGTMEGTAIATNLEAAKEIVRQIRLRNLGGQILVDFLPMKRTGNREKLLHVLKRDLNEDRGRTHVFGFTRLGLLEMTRLRRGRSLARQLLAGGAQATDADPLKAPSAVGFEILRALLREAPAVGGKGLEVRAAGRVIEELQNGLAAALKETESRLGRPVALTRLDARAADHFDIAPAGEGD